MSPGNTSFCLHSPSITDPCRPKSACFLRLFTPAYPSITVLVGQNWHIFCYFLSLLIIQAFLPINNCLCRPKLAYFLRPFKPANNISITDPCRPKFAHFVRLFKPVYNQLKMYPGNTSFHNHSPSVFQVDKLQLHNRKKFWKKQWNLVAADGNNNNDIDLIPCVWYQSDLVAELTQQPDKS